MRNVAPMKIAKIGYLAVSAALCGFGIQLLLNPNSSLQAIGVGLRHQPHLVRHHQAGGLFFQGPVPAGL